MLCLFIYLKFEDQFRVWSLLTKCLYIQNENKSNRSLCWLFISFEINQFLVKSAYYLFNYLSIKTNVLIADEMIRACIFPFTLALFRHHRSLFLTLSIWILASVIVANHRKLIIFWTFFLENLLFLFRTEKTTKKEKRDAKKSIVRIRWINFSSFEDLLSSKINLPDT